MRSTAINEEMKLAAVRALAELAKKPVPEIVNLAYNNINLVYGREYIIPAPFEDALPTMAPRPEPMVTMPALIGLFCARDTNGKPATAVAAAAPAPLSTVRRPTAGRLRWVICYLPRRVCPHTRRRAWVAK